MTDNPSHNPYPGINPHLNSQLQNNSSWKGFHSRHITHLGDYIEQRLPPGYYTANEQSLQIGVVDEGDTVDPVLSIPGITVIRGKRDATDIRSQIVAGHTIAVTNPRPIYQTGTPHVYGFGVMDALPVVAVPLQGDEVVLVDFGEVYQQTFASTRLFWQILADYTRLPERFDSYSPQDQEMIEQHLTMLREKS